MGQEGIVLLARYAVNQKILCERLTAVFLDCRWRFQILLPKAFRRKKVIKTYQGADQGSRSHIERRITTRKIRRGFTNQWLALKFEKLSSRALFNCHIVAADQVTWILHQHVEWDAVFLRHQGQGISSYLVDHVAILRAAIATHNDCVDFSSVHQLGSRAIRNHRYGNACLCQFPGCEPCPLQVWSRLCCNTGDLLTH